MLPYSVLMSLYGKEKPDYLKLSIDSMLSQTIQPNEIVILLDGHLPYELENVVLEYQKKYGSLFNIIKSEKNIGLGLALNLGLQNCRNELVARMDTDDISLPKRCEKQLKIFEADAELALVGTAVDEFFDNPDNIIYTRFVPAGYEAIYKFAKRRSAFNHPTVMFKKSKVQAFGGYAPLRRNQDVDLFGRMLFGGCRANNLQESLLLFRSSTDLEKRRRSWENTKSYIGTIYRFWRMGYSGFIDFLIVVVAQTVLFICPLRMQRWIYKRFLRERE